MIQILKDGKKQVVMIDIYKTTCNKCDCEFEFELEDCCAVERRINGAVSIKCPCCDHLIKKQRNDLECRHIEDAERDKRNTIVSNCDISLKVLEMLYDKFNITAYHSRHTDTGFEMCITDIDNNNVYTELSDDNFEIWEEFTKHVKK